MDAIGLCGKHEEVYSYIDWLINANKQPTTIWWSKRPSGLDVTQEDLRKRIVEDGYFYFYYAYRNNIVIKMKVVDFCFNDDSEKK